MIWKWKYWLTTAIKGKRTNTLIPTFNESMNQAHSQRNFYKSVNKNRNSLVFGRYWKRGAQLESLFPTKMKSEENWNKMSAFIYDIIQCNTELNAREISHHQMTSRLLLLKKASEKQQKKSKKDENTGDRRNEVGQMAACFTMLPHALMRCYKEFDSKHEVWYLEGHLKNPCTPYILQNITNLILMLV